MRPWPVELQQRYPCARGCLPERPWWYRDGDVLSRVDGRGALISMGSALCTAETEDAIAPLPFPGVRTGQVWAYWEEWDDGGPYLREITIASYHPRLCPGVTPTRYAKPWGINPGDQHLADEEIYALLSHAFLIADSGCPQRAPWSPPEAVRGSRG